MFNERNIYYGFLITLYILYFLAFFNLWNEAPDYIVYFDYFVKLIVSLILIVVFNPYYKIVDEKTSFHNEIAFTSGLFLLTTIGIMNIFERIIGFYKKVKKDVGKIK